MTNIDIVKELLRQAYQSESEADIRKLLGACIAIMDVTFEDEKPQPEPSADADPQPETQEKAPEEGAKKPGRRPLDTGKLKALREAGWPVAKIANEMGVTEQTIRNYITKLRIWEDRYEEEPRAQGTPRADPQAQTRRRTRACPRQ